MSTVDRFPLVDDNRTEPPFMDGERSALEEWLELYRNTVPLKVGGLTPEQLCARPVTPSTLSLLGIVRHLAMVERYWFGNIVAGIDQPFMYKTDDDPDAEFNDLAPHRAGTDIERFESEVAQARRYAAVVTDLDTALPGKRHGHELNLRWIYLHMIEEYARHVGHADLLRESIDGVTGY